MLLEDGLLKTDDASKVALSLMRTVWEEGADCGVAPELLAYAAMYTALTDLVTEFGEDAVSGLMRGLVDRVASGEFSVPNSTLQ
ncbi:MAG: hypothetical protein AAFY64_08565 [Pseudomonadota bacterium]